MQTHDDSSSGNLFNTWKRLKRHWQPATAIFCVTVALAAIATIPQKAIYSAEGKLSFRRSSATATLTGLGKEASDLTSLREQSSPIDTEAEIIRSHPIANDAITAVNLKDPKGNPITIKDFTKRLKVTPIKGTDIIQINYEDSDAKVSADVVNIVMDIYLEKATENYRKNAAKAIQFIEKQMPIAEEKVKKAELELRYFQETNNIASIDEERKNSLEFIFGLRNEIKTVQSQLSDTEGQLQYLQGRLGADTDSVFRNTTISESKGVQDVLAEKQKVEAQLAIDGTRYQESHPIIQGLQSQLSALNDLLQKRVESVNSRDFEGQVVSSVSNSLSQTLTAQLVQLGSKKSGLMSQNRTLTEIEKGYKQRIESLPKLEQRQRELLRYLDAAQTTYTLLLKKVEELRVAENQNASNATIVAAAIVPQEPLPSSRTTFLTAGMLLGSVFAIATALMLDSKDKSVRTTEDAIQAFGLPLIGVMPLMEDKYQMLGKTGITEVLQPNTVRLDKEPTLLLNEAAQTLGINLKVLNMKKSLKVITVTSIEEQEGKSTIAAYLAASLAQLGAKVALIDANLHSPSQSQLWHLEHNQIGLSNVLMESTDLDLAMVRSRANLSLLLAGNMPNALQPISLIDSSNMEALVKYLSSQLDYIILDTPAIRFSPDALFINKFSDGLLLVVRPEISSLDSAAYLQESMARSGQTIFGMVVNGVKAKPQIELQSALQVADHSSQSPLSNPWFPFKTEKSKSKFS